MTQHESSSIGELEANAEVYGACGQRWSYVNKEGEEYIVSKNGILLAIDGVGGFILFQAFLCLTRREQRERFGRLRAGSLKDNCQCWPRRTKHPEEGGPTVIRWER